MRTRRLCTRLALWLACETGAAGFVVKTGGATALAAGVAKTLINLIAGTRALTLVELCPC